MEQQKLTVQAIYLSSGWVAGSYCVSLGQELEPYAVVLVGSLWMGAPTGAAALTGPFGNL